MAKQNDDDFGADDFGTDDKTTSPKTKNALSGLTAKLPPPLIAVFEKIRDFFENIIMAVNSSFNDKSRPWMPIAMLGGVILVLLMFVIIMVAVLGSALSGGETAAPQKADIENQESAPESHKPEVPLELGTSSVSGDLGLNDSFLDNPILPNEPLFMVQGEIQYQREPKSFWEARDIKPGWQDLGTLYKVMLREQNSDDFYRLMGEVPPKRDGY